MENLRDLIAQDREEAAKLAMEFLEVHPSADLNKVKCILVIACLNIGVRIDLAWLVRTFEIN